MTNGTHRNGTNNGARPDTAPLGDRELDLLWDSLPPRVSKELNQPIDSALVSSRRGRGNRSYPYLEGHTAIAQANRIFGHGGWGYEVVGGVNVRDIQAVNAKTGEARTSQAYAATVRVDVPGAPSRTDVGFHAVNDDTVEGHETAYKGAVTDALKRALRSFGDQFGNALYGDPAKVAAVKEAADNRPGKEQGEDLTESQLDALRTGLINLGAEQGFGEEQVREATRSRTGKELDELTVDELEPLVKSAARKLKERQQEQKAA